MQLLQLLQLLLVFVHTLGRRSSIGIIIRRLCAIEGRGETAGVFLVGDVRVGGLGGYGGGGGGCPSPGAVGWLEVPVGRFSIYCIVDLSLVEQKREVG